VHAEALAGTKPFARAYVHAAMIGLGGEKMSKSRGNLVFVSRLRGEGVDPMAIRLALLAGHYRTDRDWTPDLLAAAQQRLDTWRRAAALPTGAPAAPVLAGLRERLADDLDSPGAIAVVDAWAAATLAGEGEAEEGAPVMVADAVDALLGVLLQEG
jgi:L-cysteine:1D-myo-inositol 2-amino-2-deoxy-alpha-D-glucopyranoside ligase